MPKLVAVVTAYNRTEFIAKCVASLLDAASNALHVQVIVMDNGSKDDTANAAQAVGESVHVVRTEDNRPIAEVLNRGLRLALDDACADYVMVMNDDTMFTPTSLPHLIAVTEKHPNAFTTPLQINYRKPDEVDASALTHLQKSRALVQDAALGRPLQETYAQESIIGAALLAHVEAWRNVGEFDELFWFYGVDDDLCTRARWLGYETLLVPGAHLLHAHGKLGADKDVVTTWPNPIHRWRKETQARYIFRLKDIERPLWRCVLHTSGYALMNTLECLASLWPRGAVESLAIFGACALRLPKIAQTRRLQFDPKRKIV